MCKFTIPCKCQWMIYSLAMIINVLFYVYKEVLCLNVLVCKQRTEISNVVFICIYNVIL